MAFYTSPSGTHAACFPSAAMLLFLLPFYALQLSMANDSFIKNDVSDSYIQSGFADSQWSREYITSTNTRDVVLSMAMDDKNKYVYIVGSTTGPRGINVSFSSLVHKDASRNETINTSRTFRDAVIAKAQASNGRLLWARRLLHNHDTTFSAVAVSVNHGAVHAVGTVMVSAETHAFIFQTYDSETGKENGNLYQARIGGRTYINSALAHDGSILVCGRTSTINYTKASIVTEMLVARISFNGVQRWMKRSGSGSKSAECSSVALSSDGNVIFVAETLHNESGSWTFVNVHAWDIGAAKPVWKQTIQRTADADIRASGILSAEDAVYVSTSTSSKEMTFRTLHVDKFSMRHGTWLWSLETCCSAVVVRDSRTPSFKEKGSAYLVTGLRMLTDRHLYHLAYYHRREEMTKDRFATLVVRIGEYGEQTPLRDISMPVETFQVMPSAPQQAVISEGNGSIYVLSNHISMTSEYVSDNVPTLQAIGFERSTVRVSSKAAEGHVYVNLTFQVRVRTVSAGNVNDFLAEYLRIAHSQIQFEIVSGMESGVVSPDQNVTSTYSIIAFGDQTEILFEEFTNELSQVFKRSGPAQKNYVERHFQTAAFSVQLIQDSIERNAEGLTGNLFRIGERRNELFGKGQVLQELLLQS